MRGVGLIFATGTAGAFNKPLANKRSTFFTADKPGIGTAPLGDFP